MAGATWSRGDKTQNTANVPSYSNGDLTATLVAFSVSKCRTTRRDLSTGKFYVEITPTWSGTPNAEVQMGIKRAWDNIDSNSGQVFSGGVCAGFNRGGTKRSSGVTSGAGAAPSFTSGDVVGLAIDLTNGKLWAHVNGTYPGSSDPETDTDPMFTWTPPVEFGIAIGNQASGVNVDFTLNSGDTAFTYSVPSGYTAGWPEYNYVDSTATYAVHDTFTDANGTTIQSHTPDVGGAWSLFGTSTGNATVESNAARYGGSNNARYENATDAIEGADDDYCIYIDSLSAGNNLVYAIANRVDAAETYYRILGGRQIQRVVAGSATTLGTNPTLTALDTFVVHVMRRTDYVRLRCFIDGVLARDYMDDSASRLSTAGNPGFMLVSTQNDVDEIAVYDGFSLTLPVPFVDVESAVTLAYGIYTETEQAVTIAYRIYGTEVEQAVEIVYRDEVQAAVTLAYALGTESVEQAVALVYAITESVEQAVTLDAGLSSVEAAVEIVYGIVNGAEAAVELVYAITESVEQAVTLDAGLSSVEAAVAIVYSLTSAAEQSVEIVYTVATEIEAAVELDYGIIDHDIIEAAVELRYAIMDLASVNVTHAATVTVGGQSFALAEGEIACDEGEFAWTCQLTLPNPAQHVLFERDAPFSVDLGGEVYAFITDSKKFSRAVDGNGAVISVCTIAGISPAAAYADPRAARITRTWDTVLARAAVEELLAGASIDWRILNWSIPAKRLGADEQAPMEIARRIVAAAGGVIESEPGGSLVVRYAHPLAVPQWDSAAADQVYTDPQHRFSAEEQFATVKTVNKLRLMDVVPAGFSDTVEFEADDLDPIRGTLKVYPSPWRETVTVDHTSLPQVSATLRGIETEELTETVEVLGGAGSVSHPIYQVVTLEWLYENLTGVAFETDARQFTTTHATKMETLLRITYRTRYIAFDAVGIPEGAVQFLVKETADG